MIDIRMLFLSERGCSDVTKHIVIDIAGVWDWLTGNFTTAFITLWFSYFLTFISFQTWRNLGIDPEEAGAFIDIFLQTLKNESKLG